VDFFVQLRRLTLFSVMFCVSMASAQNAKISESKPVQQNWGLLAPGEDPQNRVGWPLLDHIARDQVQFWTTPFHISKPDAATKLLPFLGFTSALMVGDTWLSNQVPDSPSSIRHSKSFSNYAAYSLVGGAGGMFLWGHLTHNDHQREAGFLAGEAAVNSTIATYVLKEVTRRERPYQGSGAFFQPGGSSFPSEHAAVAWSVASVVAHEYPGWLTQALAYGAATGVSLTRVTGKQHFPSDVVVGSALGWFMGRQIYRAHHDPELGGAAWGSKEPAFDEEKAPRSPNYMSSPYVPVDSWVYPALQRLEAAGYLQSAVLGQRPWTRMECARLVEEARDRMPVDTSLSDVNGRIFQALEKEFVVEEGRRSGAENLGVAVESLYTRVTGISGPPLTNSYNFGQTIVNDYGRPYQEGTNVVSGVSGYASAGPFSFYVRGEYQHAPAGPGLPDAARVAIALQTQVPVLPYTAFAATDRFRLVEGYVSANLDNLQFSFGKQALWWGPGESGPLIWSSNAEPIPMLRIATVSPFTLPGFLKYLGPAQTQFFVGQLDGQQFILANSGIVGPSLTTQPFVHGQKISFKPTPNLEFGFSRTVVFSGQGHPFTFGNFWNSYASVGDSASGVVDIRNDPGDRRSAFDVTYRVPRLRNWLTLYLDSFCDDDVLPLAAPQRCSWNPGFYVPQIPRFNRVDFRAEGITTDVSGFGTQTGVNYFNVIYRSGYTNDGNIIGSWIGRQGRGVQLSSTYSISPQSRIQAMYRLKQVDTAFLGGGRLADYAVNGNLHFGGGVDLTAGAQYEQWSFPLLSTAAKSNVSISVGLTYRPDWKWIRK